MDPEVKSLLSRVTETGRLLEELASFDPDSARCRQARRELLATSQKLTSALQNEGQIVEQYLYGVRLEYSILSGTLM